MHRLLTLVCFLYMHSALAVDADTLHTGGTCTVVLDSNSRQIARLCKSVSLFEETDAYSMITVGASVPALQINYGTGVITALSSVQPLTLQFNFLQRKLIRNSEVHTFALWCPSTGMSVSKTNQGLGIGVSMVPLGIHIDAVSFGLGAMYTAVDKITEPTRSNFSVIIPVTYALF